MVVTNTRFLKGQCSDNMLKHKKSWNLLNWPTPQNVCCSGYDDLTSSSSPKASVAFYPSRTFTFNLKNSIALMEIIILHRNYGKGSNVIGRVTQQLVKWLAECFAVCLCLTSEKNKINLIIGRCIRRPFIAIIASRWSVNEDCETGRNSPNSPLHCRCMGVGGLTANSHNQRWPV